MPIEIRELQIKAVIDNGKSGKKEQSPGPSVESSRQDPDELINLCVEKVLEILKEKAER